jgi:hypothetical protein
MGTKHFVGAAVGMAMKKDKVVVGLRRDNCQVLVLHKASRHEHEGNSKGTAPSNLNSDSC